MAKLQTKELALLFLPVGALAGLALLSPRTPMFALESTKVQHLIQPRGQADVQVDITFRYNEPSLLKKIVPERKSQWVVRMWVVDQRHAYHYGAMRSIEYITPLGGNRFRTRGKFNLSNIPASVGKLKVKAEIHATRARGTLPVYIPVRGIK